MDIKYANNLQDFEKIWKDNVEDLKTSYFCTSDWHQVVLTFYHNTFLTKILNRPVYFNASLENQSWILGFFYVTKTFRGNMINFGHLLGPSDYFDLVHSPRIATDQFQALIKQIQIDFKARAIRFSYLKETSKFYQAIAQMPTVVSFRSPCVGVSLPADYEVYFASLSKSVRQNIRTAYNRLKKNGLQFHLEIYGKSDSPQIPWEILKQLYQLRHGFKKKYWKSKLYHWLNYGFGREKDMFDFEATRETDFTLAVLKINEEIAAYFFGFQSQNTIEINRVVINDQFKFYSPGLVLFNEYIKTEIPHLECIDLTRGDEKYKFDLGGQENFIYSGRLL
jgi:hypothetical protein